MKKITCIIILYFSLASIIYAENNEEIQKYRYLFLPKASYNYTSFDNVQFHDISGGLNVIRLNSQDRRDLLFFSAEYNPVILQNKPEYPDLFHAVSLSCTRINGLHIFNASINIETYSFLGIGFYSYRLIQKDHFSMNIGAGLLVMDFGAEINNMPWYLWPIPFISFSWKYEWFELNILPNARLILAPQKPVSLILESEFGKHSAQVRYIHFKDGNPESEIFRASAGIKNASDDINLSSHRRYTIEYNAVFCTIKAFKIIELNAGWIFDGRESERKFNWDSITESIRNWGIYPNSNSLGRGFYVTISAGVNF